MSFLSTNSNICCCLLERDYLKISYALISFFNLKLCLPLSLVLLFIPLHRIWCFNVPVPFKFSILISSADKIEYTFQFIFSNIFFFLYSFPYKLLILSLCILSLAFFVLLSILFYYLHIFFLGKK